MLKWSIYCFCPTTIFLHILLLIELSFPGQGHLHVAGGRQNVWPLHVPPRPKPRQSESPIPQAVVIDTGQAGDPSQANQGAGLTFFVRVIKEQLFPEGLLDCYDGSGGLGGGRFFSISLMLSRDSLRQKPRDSPDDIPCHGMKPGLPLDFTVC